MKKILLGILILIPIIVVMLVAAVTNIVSVSAYIAVESVNVSVKSDEGSVMLDFASLAGGIVNLNDYIDVEIMPQRATNKTVEWSIIDIICLDSDYEESYMNYLSDKENEQTVLPCVMLTDEKGEECGSNTTGFIKVNSYCQFTVVVTAENHSSSVFVIAGGHKVVSVTLVSGKDTLKSGEKVRMNFDILPVDSIIKKAVFKSSDENVAVVDDNGIVTAKRAGTSEITVSVSDGEQGSIPVISAPYLITVEEGPSFYGNIIYTHLPSFSLNELGISSATDVSGCSISGDTLTMDGIHAVISTDRGNADIYLCGEDEIVIENSVLLDRTSGDVVDKDSVPLVLKARYKSDIRQDIPEVTWSSSDNETATVDDGTIFAKSKGLVTITAVCGDKTAQCELMIIETVTTISLFTSDSYYMDVIGGLAKEVVFASERYTDSEVNNDKEDNYTYIIINGLQKLTDEEKKIFLDNYDFEIVSGSEYAYFDTDIKNKLVFSDALEGQGKKEIKIKVAAKYPRYESMKRYCETFVTVKAVYGVEANNFKEFYYAAKYQETYAKEEGNVIHAINNPVLSTLKDYDTVSSSASRYAISLMSDIDYPPSRYDPIFNHPNLCLSCPKIFGDIYGNNHMLRGNSELYMGKYTNMLWVMWSDITISNVTIRANEIEGTEISSDNNVFGKCIDIWSDTDQKTSGHTFWDAYYKRITNITMEFTILENCFQLGRVLNADVYINGCVFRNVGGIGFHISHSMQNISGQKVPVYSHVTFNNIVFSHSLGPVMSVFSEGYTKDGNGNNYFSPDDNENLRIIRENYIDKGLYTTVKQEGFMDIYNWFPLESVTLVQTGNPEIDNLIAAAVSSVLITDPAIAQFRYRYKNETWLDVGIMVSGVNSNDSLSTEPILTGFSAKDDRFGMVSLSELGSDDALGSVLQRFPINFYCYESEANIKPSTTYVLDSRYINRLHGDN